jgi:signal transduction histidine kinase
MGQLKNGMLHDFNNMLGIIHGNASLAMEHIKTGDAGFDELQEIAFAARRAQTIAKHILNIGRSIEISCSRVCLCNLITDSINMIQCMVPETINIKLALSQKPLYINADQCLIEQVIVNLCKNAIHAMPHGGALTIKTHEIHGRDASFSNSDNPRRKFAAIKIFDTGCGIPNDMIEKIFNPFFSTKPKDQGAGLGLFISKYIVQSHGGSIHVNSIPGNGAIFTIYLPLA